ncbi:unnamed protein product [Angiostrongylus costaricensis]|uniref:MFS domain-containing protein n=1 Tax=Angiostrongylus costaricensis TaxID=334426 RepID=A0A0R3PR98_ANGCS|nr:unnamed protein product [Angiostrongylus costaricensis]
MDVIKQTSENFDFSDRMNFYLLTFGLLSAVVNFPEGYSNSYPNTSYKSFQRMINGSYIARGNEVRHLVAIIFPTHNLMSNKYSQFQKGISQEDYIWIWSAILNVWFLGYFFGTFLTPCLLENMGRKRTLLCSNVIALLGSMLSFLSVTISVPELFFVSRIVASISSGLSFGSLILFLQETSPTEYRGMTSFLSENTFTATTVMGIGFGMDTIFGKNLPVLTGISTIPAIISIIIVIPLRETPKYLLINRKNRKAAKESLKFYRGNTIDADAILDEMLLEIDDKVCSEGSILRSAMRVLRESHLRTPFFIGCLSLQIVAGIWPIIYLSTDIFSKHFTEQASQSASLLFITASFVAGMCGMFIIERFGRRTLMLWLGFFNIVSLMLFVVFEQLSSLFEPLKWGCIVAMTLFGITYGIGLGPIAFFITSELVAQQHRSLVQSMVFASWAFIPLFIVPSSLSMTYLFLNMPETAGREVHEIVQELLARTNKKQVQQLFGIQMKVCSTKIKSPIYFCGTGARKQGHNLK